MNTDNKLIRSIAILAFIIVLILTIPLAAMQYSREVVWTLSDFIVAGTLLFSTGLTYILVTQKSRPIAYRLAVGFALFTGLLLVWINLAVGLTGSEDDPVNLWYFGVVAVGTAGTIISRFRPAGMVITLFSTALTQALVAVVVLIGGYYPSPPSTAFHIISINGFFTTLFVISALLFSYVDQESLSVAKSSKDNADN